MHSGSTSLIHIDLYVSVQLNAGAWTANANVCAVTTQI